MLKNLIEILKNCNFASYYHISLERYQKHFIELAYRSMKSLVCTLLGIIIVCGWFPVYGEVVATNSVSTRVEFNGASSVSSSLAITNTTSSVGSSNLTNLGQTPPYLSSLNSAVSQKSTTKAKNKSAMSSKAPEKPIGDTIAVRMFFQQDISDLDFSYMGNRLNIQKFAEQLQRLENNPYVSIGNILITSSASPEGPYKRNQSLALNRAERARKLLLEYAPNLKSPVSIRPKTINWDLLVRMVTQDSLVPNRKEVLEVLRTAPELKKAPKLKALRGGRAWKYMYDRFFPEMRTGELLICNFEVKFAKADSLKMAGVVGPDCRVANLEPTEINFTQLPRSPKPVFDFNSAYSRSKLYVSLSTNMLYDLLLVPNIGAEVFEPNSRLSLALNWWYAWWNSDRLKWYWRYYGGDVALRWYFGDAAKQQPFSGHHLGLYGEYYTYDLELGGKGYMGGIPRGTLWDKGNIACGLEYGYSVPLTERFNLDFMIGVGYSGGEQRQYVPAQGGEGYVWERTIRRNFIGPTKAGVTLEWLVNSRNTNYRWKQKGGSK